MQSIAPSLVSYSVLSDIYIYKAVHVGTGCAADNINDIVTSERPITSHSPNESVRNNCKHANQEVCKILLIYTLFMIRVFLVY